MSLPGSWRFARSAALLAIAVLLLGGGTLLSWYATGSGVHFAGSRVVHGADAFPPNGGQPAVLEGEAERDQSPVNAGLLTALLLATFLGTSAGWQLAYDWRRAVTRPLCAPCGPSLETAREEASFLSVFRL